MSLTKIFTSIFHISVVALNSFTICYDQMYVDLPFPSKEVSEFPLKARFLFVTILGLTLQTIYFSISFLNDIYGTDAPSPRHPPLIRRIKDFIFSLAFTLGIYVAIAFWTLYALYKDLIFPDDIEAALPPWMNHIWHTTIVPFILIELFVTNRNYPSRKHGINLFIFSLVAYKGFLFYIYFRTGIWVYPFLGVLSWPMKFVFCVVNSCIVLGIYIIGEKLNSLLSPVSKSYANGVYKNIKSH